MSPIDDERFFPELERRLARLDNEHLGVGVSMELRADARLGVNEDDRERDVAVLGADEFMGVPAVFEVVELDDRSRLSVPVFLGHRSSLPSAYRPAICSP